MRSYITFNVLELEADTIADSFTPDELELLELQADAVLAELTDWLAGSDE